MISEQILLTVDMTVVNKVFLFVYLLRVTNNLAVGKCNRYVIPTKSKQVIHTNIKRKLRLGVLRVLHMFSTIIVTLLRYC